MTCLFCGGELPLGTKRRNYCKDSHRQAAYRNRKSTPTPRPCYGTSGLLTAPVGLTPYVYPERVFHTEGPTPGALQGDDYPLTYDADGDVELPACLDRRKPKLGEVAA
jgi:hypothetical protein